MSSSKHKLDSIDPSDSLGSKGLEIRRLQSPWSAKMHTRQPDDAEKEQATEDNKGRQR